MENRTPIAEQIFGHNKAPLDQVLETDFADLAAEVDAAVKKITARPAKVKDDTDFAAVGQIAIDARKMTKRIEDTRKDETVPLDEAKREIKAYFDDLAGKLTAAIKPHTDAADNYTREKAAAERRKREEEAKKLREKEEAERQKAASATGQTAARAEGRAEAYAAQAEEAEADAGMKAADAVRTRAGGVTASASTKWDYAIEDYNAIDLNVLKPFMNRDHVEQAIRSLIRVQKGNASLPGVRIFQDTRAAFR